MEHYGYKVWVTAEGGPGIKRVRRKPPPKITRENITSNLIMRQENTDGSGKYFNERLLAFERIPKKWVILYETKTLQLMNSAEKYNEIWPSNRTDEEIDAIKPSDHILEISTSTGPVVLEGLFHSSDKSSLHGRFLVCHPQSEKKLFKTRYAGPGGFCPLLRQFSNEIQKSSDFHVSCRPIAVRGIDMVFIVYPSDTHLELPPIIDRETYKRIIDMPLIMMFKQVTPLKL